MDLKQVQSAIKQIAQEKGLSAESIIETLNTALAAAYRKDFGHKNQNITFKLDTESGEMEIFDTKKVVDYPEEILAAIRENGIDKKYVHGQQIEEEVSVKYGSDRKRLKTDEELDRELAALSEEVIKYNPKTDILLEEAKKLSKKKYTVGQEIVTELPLPTEFGRMAAQTAKQVIIQKLREAERSKVFEEFQDKAGELLNAYVQRREGRTVLIDLGKTTAVMPPEQQVRTEKYNPGDRIKVYVVAVSNTIKGPEILVSRTHPSLIAKLFETEIPEIASGAIEIKGIAREPGFRGKVSVMSHDDAIDPIGSCVGQRGARIQTIIAELSGEKIDIIEYDADPAKYIGKALSPAKVTRVEVLVNPKGDVPGEATAIVPEDQLSLAIGKEGQNVRLAAKLTGWKINIMKDGDTKIAAAASTDETEAPIIAEELKDQTPLEEDIADNAPKGVVEGGEEGVTVKEGVLEGKEDEEIIAPAGNEKEAAE